MNIDSYSQGWGQGIFYAIMSIFVSEIVSVASFFAFRFLDRWLLGVWNLIPGIYQLIVVALLVFSFWISFKLIQFLITPKKYFLGWSVFWFVVITGGWLIYRNIQLRSVDGMMFVMHPLDEVLSVALSTIILVVSTYMFLGGQFSSLQRELRKLWKRFYATWLS